MHLRWKKCPKKWSVINKCLRKTIHITSLKVRYLFLNHLASRISLLYFRAHNLIKNFKHLSLHLYNNPSPLSTNFNNPIKEFQCLTSSKYPLNSLIGMKTLLPAVKSFSTIQQIKNLLKLQISIQKKQCLPNRFSGLMTTVWTSSLI